jgi:hypothetical protein
MFLGADCMDFDRPFYELDIKGRVCFMSWIHSFSGLTSWKEPPKCIGSECSNYWICTRDEMEAMVDTRKAIIEYENLGKTPPDSTIICPILKASQEKCKGCDK